MAENVNNQSRFGKDVKRKQISLHPEEVYDNPRLNRKFSYTDQHLIRVERSKSKKPASKRQSNGFNSVSRGSENTQLYLTNPLSCKDNILRQNFCNTSTNLPKPAQTDSFHKPSIQKQKSGFPSNFGSQHYLINNTNNSSHILFSPDGRNIDQSSRYANPTSQPKKRQNKSKRGQSKKFNQTALLKNKDYKCIEPNDWGFMSGEGKQRRDNNESVKTIEIDVGQGQPWFGLGEIKGTVEKTQEVLRQVLKNYFWFLEYFKKLEDFGAKVVVIDDLREVKGVKQKIEELIYHDARGVQKSNMDIDGIQNQIMDYEILLNKITDLTNEKSAQIERHWNDQIFTQIHTQKNEVKDDKDNEIIFQLYEQKISKLEIDLKREKELRQVKYYRSDKKTTEINSLRKEKDELVNRCKKYQNFIKELEAQNMIALHENQQISCNLHLKVSEWKELNSKLSEFLVKKPSQLQPKHMVRIQELETEIEELKELIKSFELMSQRNSMADNTKDLLEKLSVMLLNKNTDPNFFSESQKALIRSLFGDYATKTYKDKINELTIKLNSVEKWNKNRNVNNDDKPMVEKCLYYLNLLWKIIDKLSKDPKIDYYNYSQLLPTKESLVEDKIHLVEIINNFENDIEEEPEIIENLNVESFMSREKENTLTFSSEPFFNNNDDDELEIRIIPNKKNKGESSTDDKTPSHSTSCDNKAF